MAERVCAADMSSKDIIITAFELEPRMTIGPHGVTIAAPLKDGIRAKQGLEHGNGVFGAGLD
ncbi:hypothetical protein [Paracoccus acridae]|uniref:hypothetical protein n=1 Tax=Paracoccus acridae TaxID=1795310 RepID=UPI001663E875|nr:hypothetical protein [Paracoccus acridae]